jgi:hypothetical protein
MSGLIHWRRTRVGDYPASEPVSAEYPIPADANLIVGGADVAVGNPVPVSGCTVAGAAVVERPVLIGGVQKSGADWLVRRLRTDDQGRVWVGMFSSDGNPWPLAANYTPRVSLYAMGSAEADTPVVVESQGNVRVALYSGATANGPTAPLTSVGVGDVVVAANTRPADTNAYAAGDVLCNSTSAPLPITFANCVRANGATGYIHGALAVIGANQATKAQFELWLFHTAPVVDNDNAAWTPTSTEESNLVAILDFTATPKVGDATAGAGGNCVYEIASAGRFFKAAAASRNLSGVVVMRNAYTPVSGEVWTFKLKLSWN